MRIFSIQQPRAQLIVRGVLRIEVRGWETDYRGPVAIHASLEKPSKPDAARWFREREAGRHFAAQGWLDREDLKALPYGAIVGTARLAAVHRGSEMERRSADLFAWNPGDGNTESWIYDAERREMRLAKRKKSLMTVPLGADDYAWFFVDPVEINPVTGVDGKQKLWNLDGEIADVVAERERRARKGTWRPPAVSASRRDKAMRAWRERWRTAREQMMEEVERVVRRRRELTGLRLRPDAERMVREDVARYVSQFSVKVSPGEEPRVWIHSSVRGIFPREEQVTVAEFEYVLRKRLKEHGAADWARRRAERRREEMEKIIDAAEEGAGGRVDEKRLRASLEKALDKLLEEQEEDIEFVRRELSPIGEARLKAAAIRRRERERAEAIAAEEKRQRAIERLTIHDVWDMIYEEQERLERVQRFRQLRRELRDERGGR